MSETGRKPVEARVWRRWQAAELPELASDKPDTGKPVSVVRPQPAAPTEPTPEQLREAAKRDIAKAREQAQREGQRAGREEGLRLGREAGYAQGLEEGRQAAAQELQQHIRDTLAPLSTLAENMESALRQLEEELAGQVVELALSVGHQLARDSLSAQPARVLRLVRELLRSEFNLGDKPRLWLHPDDLALVEEAMAQELALAGWELRPDAELTRGGCRASGPCGAVDATWEERWRSVTQRVRKPRARRSNTSKDES